MRAPPVGLVLGGARCRRERRAVESWQRTAARRAELVWAGRGELHEVELEDGRVRVVPVLGGAS